LRITVDITKLVDVRYDGPENTVTLTGHVLSTRYVSVCRDVERFLCEFCNGFSIILSECEVTLNGLVFDMPEDTKVQDLPNDPITGHPTFVLTNDTPREQLERVQQKFRSAQSEVRATKRKYDETARNDDSVVAAGAATTLTHKTSVRSLAKALKRVRREAAQASVALTVRVVESTDAVLSVQKQVQNCESRRTELETDVAVLWTLAGVEAESGAESGTVDCAI